MANRNAITSTGDIYLRQIFVAANVMPHIIAVRIRSILANNMNFSLSSIAGNVNLLEDHKGLTTA
jgi:hypothetical protein